MFSFIPLLSLLNSIIPTIAQIALQLYGIMETPFPHTLSKIPTKASYSSSYIVSLTCSQSSGLQPLGDSLKVPSTFPPRGFWTCYGSAVTPLSYDPSLILFMLLSSCLLLRNNSSFLYSSHIYHYGPPYSLSSLSQHLIDITSWNY